MDKSNRDIVALQETHLTGTNVGGLDSNRLLSNKKICTI